MQHLANWTTASDKTWQHLIDDTLHSFEFKKDDGWANSVSGNNLGLLFFNPSLRTRTSMELAGSHLGAHVTTLVSGAGTWDFEWKDGAVMDGSAAEHIREAVSVLSRYYDALGVRVFASGDDYEADKSDNMLNSFIKHASVPVVNMESAFYHPCQALADAATIRNHLDNPERKKLVLSWTYHPKALPMAVPNSALLMAARLGMNVTVASPESHRLDGDIMAKASSYKGSVQESHHMDAAYEDADIIYAKAWGGPLVYTDADEEVSQREANKDWRVSADRMAKTNDAAFMHCLPVRRNVVVDDAVIDGPNSIHLTQAEMRLHAQKAILRHLWNLDGDAS